MAGEKGIGPEFDLGGRDGERAFAAGIIPVVVVEGRQIVLDLKKKTVEDFTPQILIFSNGDLTSFEIALQNDRGDRARVYSDAQTNIRLALPGKEEADVPAGAGMRTVQRP